MIRVAAEHIDRWLTLVLAHYQDRVLPIDARIAELWGRLGATDPLSTIDGLLAATALVHGLTLVTRNMRHVERTGARCSIHFSSRTCRSESHAWLGLARSRRWS